MNKLHLTFLIFMTFLFSFGQSIPKNAMAVKPFSLEKYLGTWYEIARFDYRFEKNLDNVTATYSLRKDGKIKVDNKGRDYVTQKWKQSVGKAKLAGEKDEAKLKVSFFGPFYSGYNVITIDANYQYALVIGKSKKYMWILSRTKKIPREIKAEYLQKAKTIGCDIDQLIWVNHDE
jgi:apolipoprotein D and lipocalin family protein